MLEKFKQKPIYFHFLVILGVCIVLYVSFFISLSYITRHTQEKRIPNVISKDMREAMNILEGMGFDVIVDSVYDPEKKPYEVLGQVPDSGSMVKNGRMMFISVNKATPPMTQMPNLVGISFRSAQLILKSNKLTLGDTSFRPDVAKGAVLEQSMKGKKLKVGDMIPQGSRINLVIGDGMGNTQFSVPDVIGQSYDEAMANLSSRGIQTIANWEERITDSSSAIIYNQQPKAFNEAGTPNTMKEGDIVNIFVKQHPTKTEIETNKNNVGSSQNH
jgi:beta-lactam-binding protein with PASTA domain